MEDLNAAKRNAILLLLHALLWAFAMIAVGALWESNDIVPWMAVGFAIMNSLLIAATSRKNGCDD